MEKLNSQRHPPPYPYKTWSSFVMENKKYWKVGLEFNPTASAYAESIRLGLISREGELLIPTFDQCITNLKGIYLALELCVENPITQKSKLKKMVIGYMETLYGTIGDLEKIIE